VHLVWNTARLCLIFLLCALVQCELYIKHKISEQLMNFKCEETEVLSQALQTQVTGQDYRYGQ
jgi:hypothetical protein